MCVRRLAAVFTHLHTSRCSVRKQRQHDVDDRCVEEVKQHQDGGGIDHPSGRCARGELSRDHWQNQVTEMLHSEKCNTEDSIYDKRTYI